MSIWPLSRVANTRRIVPTRATLPTTAFRRAGIARSMRCGLTRPHLMRWRRSRITLPSIRTVSTRSANRRRRPSLRSVGRALSVRGAVAGGPGVRRQPQFCVGDDIADIAVVVDEADLAVAPLEPHHVARLRIGAVFEHRDHFPALEPGWGEPHAIELVIDGEEHTDVRAADAKRVGRLMEFHVVGQQRPQAVPVPLVEERDIARHRGGRRLRARKRAGLRVDLPKTRATPREMALHGVDREVKESGDLYQRLVEHVLEDD